MLFEWDENKDRENRRKHRLSFALAATVFFDPLCRTFHDRDTDRDERFWTIGAIPNLNVIVVVHTVKEEHGEEIIRIISARKATALERGAYEESRV